MGKRQELSENERQTVIGMPTAGFSQRDVAQKYNVHPSVFHRPTYKPSFRTNGNVNNWQSSDRSRKKTVKQDRSIVTTHLFQDFS